MARHRTKRLSKNVKYHSGTKTKKTPARPRIYHNTFSYNTISIEKYECLIDNMIKGDMFVFEKFAWQEEYESKKHAINDISNVTKEINRVIFCLCVSEINNDVRNYHSLVGRQSYTPKNKSFVRCEIGDCGIYIGKLKIEDHSSAKIRRAHCFHIGGKTVMINKDNYPNIIPL